jgi:polyisoprenoid-binding protein YceI
LLHGEYNRRGQYPRRRTRDIDFSASGSINRSDFGIGFTVPNVSDKVNLTISASFERNN